MRIAVAGDGIAAHLAALMLARVADVVRVPVGAGGHGLGPIGETVLGSPAWMESDAAGAIGAVAGMAPALGIAFAGWSAEPWFLPFGDVGASLEDVPFMQMAARLRAEGTPVRAGDFSLAAMAAQAGRFAPRADDPRSPLSTLRPGAIYPAAALAERIAALAAAAGVEQAAALAVAMNADDCLMLVDGTRLTADLFVDASGGAAGIATGEWESWRDWLPCCRMVSRRVADAGGPAPYPLHTATAFGWQAVIALPGARVETRYAAAGAGEAYENGRRTRTWLGRRVAIGAAAGVIEPNLGQALQLAHDAIARLIELLPAAGSEGRAEAAEYHRLTAQQYDRARDAAVALWLTAGRPTAPPGPELARKLALFRRRGYLPLEDGECLSRDDWAVLLDGQGVRQQRLDPLAAALPAPAIAAHMARLRERLIQAVAAMPPLAGEGR